MLTLTPIRQLTVSRAAAVPAQPPGNRPAPSLDVPRLSGREKEAVHDDRPW